jgi:hypothetical protein
MYSKVNKEALKAVKNYINNDVWHCYWHGLSGDELKTQIFTVAHKPSDKMVSFSFYELSAGYKLNEEQGIKDVLNKEFKVEADELVPYVLEFLNDAKIEYTGRPYIKEIA